MDGFLRIGSGSPVTHTAKTREKTKRKRKLLPISEFFRFRVIKRSCSFGQEGKYEILERLPICLGVELGNRREKKLLSTNWLF